MVYIIVGDKNSKYEYGHPHHFEKIPMSSVWKEVKSPYASTDASDEEIQWFKVQLSWEDYIYLFVRRGELKDYDDYELCQYCKDNYDQPYPWRSFGNILFKSTKHNFYTASDDYMWDTDSICKSIDLPGVVIKEPREYPFGYAAPSECEYIYMPSPTTQGIASKPMWMAAALCVHFMTCTSLLNDHMDILEYIINCAYPGYGRFVMPTCVERHSLCAAAVKALLPVCLERLEKHVKKKNVPVWVKAIVCVAMSRNK